jgi:raffinose/stachyose/melibiose transport system permease protein
MFITKKTKGLKKGNRNATALGFLIVPLILYSIFVIAPIIQAAYFGFFKWNGLGPIQNFVGFDNFKTILTDGIFHKALFHNFLIIALSMALQLPTALILALVIGRRLRGSVIFRSILFLPYILSEVITGVMWQFIYHPQFGFSNSILAKIFPVLKDTAFLGNPNTVFYAIFVVLWWKYFGLHMVLYIAGLQGIPEEIEEAAYIDGATEWRLNWHIIIPMLKPTIMISVFFSIIGSIQTFDIVWAMGQGDPINSAETMVTYLYKFGFQRFNIAYGSAVAIIIFVICLAVNLIYQRILARQEKD